MQDLQFQHQKPKQYVMMMMIEKFFFISCDNIVFFNIILLIGFKQFQLVILVQREDLVPAPSTHKFRKFE